MSIFEYDEEAVRRTLQRDAYADGKEAGQTEGRAAGIIEGKVKGQAESIIKLLEKKGDLSQLLREAILSQRDLERLNEWFDAAIDAKSVEEWEQIVDREAKF